MSDADVLVVEIGLGLFRGELDWSDSAAAVSDLLATSVRINRRYLRSHPDCPSPFSPNASRRGGHLRYLHAHANESKERFRAIPEILEAGGSDCDGLVPYVVAWRIERENDPKARCMIQWKRGLEIDTLRYHVLEVRGDGAVADPCRYFGM